VSPGYERLAQLAERERELIEAARWGELRGLNAERARLVASLPARPPEEARRLLEHTRRLVRGNAAALAAALCRANEELAVQRRRRRAAQRFGAAAAVPGLDLRA